MMEERFSAQFAADGAWCFFADPRAVFYEGKHRRTYVGWLTAQGDVMAGVYDHRTGAAESVVVKPGLQKDDHANPSLYIDDRGRITIFYSAHNGSAMYYRTTETSEELSSLGAEHLLPANTEGKKGYTYPTPVYLRQERLFYLFWRGGNFKPNFSVSSSLYEHDWSEAQTLIMDEGQRPYIRYASNGEDTIHFACTDGHPNVEPHNSIYYARYRDGAYYKADGTKVKPASGLPLNLDEIDVVYDGRAEDRNAWIWDVSFDREGHPVIVYAVFVSETDHRYYYSIWNGGHWETNEIASAGAWFPQTPEGKKETETYYSGGIVLDSRSPDTVYLSRPVNGVFEIERRHTADRGRTWTTAPVTSGSFSNQVRPFLARNYSDDEALLLWMSGDYIHFTDYRTSLQMTLVKPGESLHR